MSQIDRAPLRPAAPPSGAAVSRLLAALGPAGAYGQIVEERQGPRLAIFAARSGISLRVASASPAEAEALVAADLAFWEGGGSSGRRRLRLSQPGRARLARDGADAGLVAPFQAQHATLAPSPDAPALMNERESPLVWLARRRGRDGAPLIDAAMAQAGERLRRDLTLAQMLPRVTANWSAAVASGRRAAGPGEASDTALAARQRASQALEAVGPDFAGVLLDVCGFLKGLEIVEGERGWPRHSGRVVLGLALARLAAHYGLGEEARGRAGAPMRAWAEACEPAAAS